MAVNVREGASWDGAPAALPCSARELRVLCTVLLRKRVGLGG